MNKLEVLLLLSIAIVRIPEIIVHHHDIGTHFTRCFTVTHRDFARFAHVYVDFRLVFWRLFQEIVLSFEKIFP